QVELLPDAAGAYLVGLFGAGQSAGDEQEIDPGDYTAEGDAVDAGGKPFTFSLPITVTAKDFPVHHVELPPAVSALLAPDLAFTGPLSVRGNFIAIDHGLGVYTGYAHLSRILASVGAAVKPGDVIGLVGTTGLSTGPHLHWEVAVHGMNVDAMLWTWDLMP